MKRLDFLSKAFTLCVGKGLEALENNKIVSALESLAEEKPSDPKKRERPPGAAPTFTELCTGCDACMVACPVNVIMIENLEARHPLIYPEVSPCIHCDGYPCIASCNTGALSLEFAPQESLSKK
ncbi:MAG: ferredoxin [Chlamydiales bacterium]|jgi:ferredoxin